MRDGHTLLQDQLKALQGDEAATIRRMAQSGATDAEIGRQIQRDRQYVGRRRRELGIDPGQPPRLRAMMARLHLRRLCARVTA
jgi:hypothetical protein